MLRSTVFYPFSLRIWRQSQGLVVTHHLIWSLWLGTTPDRSDQRVLCQGSVDQSSILETIREPLEKIAPGYLTAELVACLLIGDICHWKSGRLQQRGLSACLFWCWFCLALVFFMGLIPMCFMHLGPRNHRGYTWWYNSGNLSSSF